MGSSKKVTVSYWYKLIAHLGLCKGPVDAVLEIRGGDRTAWKGRQTTSGIISVNKPNLYGGEKSEGGIDGDFEVMMGNADQMPNPYLATEFGEAQSGYRGRATILLRGPKIGAGNPYPKPLYFKLERILKGWDNDVCWYPEKAPILLDTTVIPYDGVWKYKVELPGSTADYSSASYDDSSWAQGPGGFGSIAPPGSTLTVNTFIPGQIGKAIWIRRTVNFIGTTVIDVYHDDGAWLYIDGEAVTLETVSYFHSKATVSMTGNSVVALKVVDGEPSGTVAIFAGLAFTGSTSVLQGMNPAHILYDSITSRRENGGMEEPVGRINDASFRAAADRLFDEGFGLCTSWKGGESAEAFQQRILNAIGGSLTQSRKDGMYYIDLLRGDYDVDDLPTLTDDDIIDWAAEPALPSESINQIQVKWFDPETREERITTPVQALGAIENAGGVLPDVREYYEIPQESLAMRVCQRDLRAAATPLWRIDISCTRKPFDLRPGTYLRLLCPKRGFADTVVVIGDIDYGNFGGDEISLKTVQDVFGLPDAAYVDPQPSLGPPTGGTPPVIFQQTAMEAPYVELVAALSTADLDALSPESGFLLLGAGQPSSGNNYYINTKALGEEYEQYGVGEFCGIATIVEGDALQGGDVVPRTSFTFINEKMLDRVEVGTWAAWGDELCSVDAIDTVAKTLTLGRGCADTVAQDHDAGSVIYFLGDWNYSDSREYVDGEQVFAKLLNINSQDAVALADAIEMSVEMDARQYRPYPPAKVRVNGSPYPDSVIGAITLTWVHRDRLLQADQLVDTEEASIGPESGTTYTVRWYINDVLEHTDSGIAGTSVTYSPVASGLMRVELESVRDSVASWQMQVREFSTGSPFVSEAGELITTENNETIIFG